jgi:hypothetical protein
MIMLLIMIFPGSADHSKDHEHDHDQEQEYFDLLFDPP